MYLTKKITTYSSLINKKPSVIGKLREEVINILGEPYDSLGSVSISVEMRCGYWRKANHIHNWFVENVQGGEDDCRRHYFKIDDLKKLREVCLEVLKDREKAKELLPTTGGFFFGETDYGEYYFNKTEDTVKIIDTILADPNLDLYEFYYQSSW